MLCVLEGEQCAAENTHLYQAALVGSAALLFIIIAGIILWIILKVNTGCFSVGVCGCVIKYYRDSHSLMESCGLSPFSCFAYFRCEFQF